MTIDTIIHDVLGYDMYAKLSVIRVEWAIPDPIVLAVARSRLDSNLALAARTWPPEGTRYDVDAEGAIKLELRLK